MVWQIYVRGGHSGLLLWIIIVCLGGAIFAIMNIGMCLFEVVYKSHRKQPPLKISQIALTNDKLLLFIVLCITCLFANAWILQNNESDVKAFEIGRYCNIPTELWVIVWLITATTILYISFKDHDISFIHLIGIYIITVVIAFYSNYILNPFSDSAPNSGFWNEILRSTYITETIYNVIDSVPYTFETTGLYGHYGLFFIWLKLCNSSRVAVIVPIILGICAAITQGLMVYSISAFCPRKWMGVVLSLAFLIRQVSYCPAIGIIRPVFPSVFTALFVFFYKNDFSLKKKQSIFLVFLVLSMLWNFETGIACGLAAFAYTLFEVKSHKGIRIKLQMAISLMSLLVSIIVAIFIVNIYNIFICKGPVILKEFFYPILADGGTNILDFIGFKIPVGNYMWIWIVSTLFICITWTVYNMNDKMASILGATSVMGIVLFGEYFEEPLYNMYQPLFPILAVIISIFSKILYREKVDSIKKYTVLCIYVCLSIVSVQIINDPIRISARNNAKAYDIEDVKRQIYDIDAVVPTETYGVGLGVNYIYHILDWDNHAKLRDVSALDFSLNAKDELLNEMLNQESFFIGDSIYEQDLIKVVQEKRQYRIKHIFTVGENQYMYYSVER